MLIETGEHRILFDTGASDAFAENAECMGLDLRTVNTVILSHGHYDHGGGLERFLKISHRAKVWASPHAFEPHFNASGKDIGLPPALRAQTQIHSATEPVTELYSGITLHQGNEIAVEDCAGMSAICNGVHMPEDFRHEQYLLIQEGNKRILISGCSHRGILNIAEHFRADILIGGFHLMKEIDTSRLSALAERLQKLPTRFYTGHCTGELAFSTLKQHLGNQLHRFSTGDCLKL